MCWSTKAAISLKRVKIEERLLWIGGPIGTHQRCFKRHRSQPPTTSSSPRFGFATPTHNPNRYYLKHGCGPQIWPEHLLGPSEQKPIKNFGKSSRGHRPSQELPKFFRALIYRAHRTVIFATAQLSCFEEQEQQQSVDV